MILNTLNQITTRKLFYSQKTTVNIQNKPIYLLRAKVRDYIEYQY